VAQFLSGKQRVPDAKPLSMMLSCWWRVRQAAPVDHTRNPHRSSPPCRLHAMNRRGHPMSPIGAVWRLGGEMRGLLPGRETPRLFLAGTGSVDPRGRAFAGGTTPGTTTVPIPRRMGDRESFPGRKAQAVLTGPDSGVGVQSADRHVPLAIPRSGRVRRFGCDARVF
jgi:hypothetical protein